jgi:DNA-binding LytR/AlgR family response regulator
MMKRDEINCIIIEDEAAAARILETHIAGIPFLQLGGKFISVEKALPMLNEIKPDLIFLDIHLPGISGIQFAQSAEATAGIVFTTAFSEFAVESFELDVIDYLLKPISFERFSKAVNRYLKYHDSGIAQLESFAKTSAKPFIVVRSERRTIKIILDDILYLEAQRNYLLLYTENETYRIYQSISDMEEKLPEGLFVRIHRSFIVSVNKVRGYSAAHAMIADRKIPIGRVYAKVAESFKSFRR